uniref:Uncharacterized protein n=1 Tax=Noctiluca scintillans TaxID=2966 RepID=A0A7S0ZWE3_NOCSC
MSTVARWVEDVALQGVVGMSWWDAKPREERHRIASVLLGLEGSEPRMRSPFDGSKHDASGASKPISAIGSRKWRAYRVNNALQIPADCGGIRCRITRKMFSELIDVTWRIGLTSPWQDLLLKRGEGFSRDVLEQRFLEKELFKLILSGSSREAKEALAGMQAYRERHRTPDQVSGGLVPAKIARKKRPHPLATLSGPPANVHMLSGGLTQVGMALFPSSQPVKRTET